VPASQFFSPKEPTASGWIWEAGPAELLPTESDEVLGAEKWGLGPTAVALKQAGPWTNGGLANHIWSVAGDGDRADIRAIGRSRPTTGPRAGACGLSSRCFTRNETSDRRDQAAQRLETQPLTLHESFAVLRD
jgi:hypothetical protein